MGDGDRREAPSHLCGSGAYECWLDLERDEELISRLHNHKFDKARALLRPEHPVLLRDVVTALADLYGNPGWALEGTAGALVDAVLDLMRGCPHGPEPEPVEYDAVDISMAGGCPQISVGGVVS